MAFNLGCGGCEDNSLWIIILAVILLSSAGGNSCSRGCDNGCNNGCGGFLSNLFNNEWILIILLLLLFSNDSCGCSLFSSAE